MKKIWSLLAFALLSSSLCAAKPYGYRAPLPEAEGIQKEASLFGLSSIKEIQNNGLLHLFEQTLATMDLKGEIAVMANGSEWNFNWVWSMRTKGWLPGDKILISHEPKNWIFPQVRIENITQGSVAWGMPHREPKWASPELIWIQEIHHNSLLLLNNGIHIDTKSSGWVQQFGWTPGDTIMLMPNPADKGCFDIWNFPKNSVIAGIPFSALLGVSEGY